MKVFLMAAMAVVLVSGCAPKRRSESSPQLPALPLVPAQLHLGDAKIAKLEKSVLDRVALQQAMIQSYYQALSKDELDKQLEFIKSLNDKTISFTPKDKGAVFSIDARTDYQESFALSFDLKPVDQQTLVAYLEGYVAEFTCLDTSDFCTPDKDAFIYIKKLRTGGKPPLGATYFHTLSKGKAGLVTKDGSDEKKDIQVRDFINLDRNWVITTISVDSNFVLNVVSDETDKIPNLQQMLGKISKDETTVEIIKAPENISVLAKISDGNLEFPVSLTEKLKKNENEEVVNDANLILEKHLATLQVIVERERVSIK